jgi:hypothetical protein
MWAHFLADVFYFSSYRPTKNLCLEGLAKLLVRFGTPWTKNYLYFTITRLEDPSYVEFLTVCLREAGVRTSRAYCTACLKSVRSIWTHSEPPCAARSSLICGLSF